MIDAAYGRLEQRTLYQVLGVDADVDKQTIRTAYFDLSKRFHPDSLFGVELGEYGGKMEAVFKRLTEAYETLGKKKKRREYDEYCAATVRTREAQEALQRTELEAREIVDSERHHRFAVPARGDEQLQDRVRPAGRSGASQGHDFRHRPPHRPSSRPPLSARCRGRRVR